MKKVEYGINTQVAQFMEENYDWITRTIVNDKEDYEHYDIAYSATTKTGKIKGCKQEVKSIRNYPLKEGGKFRKYYKKDIKEKMRFGNTPKNTTNTNELPKYWNKTPEKTDIPDNIKDIPIYFLNASDIYNNIHNSKWHYMQEENIGLTLVAEDGIIMFSPGQLKDAFLTYAWYLNKSHTELYNKQYNPHYELKAVIDLRGGTYFPNVIDKNLLNNNIKN